MAQVGRISGPLLQENLLRKGTTSPASLANLSFRNTLNDTQLLYLDVNNNKIGVNTGTPSSSADINVSGTTRTTNLIADSANIDGNSISVYSNNLDITGSSWYLNAPEAIVLSNLETSQFYVTDNIISTKDSDANIEFSPIGLGTVESLADLNVFGNIHSPGNITFDGNVTIGDDSTVDTVNIEATIADNIIPDSNYIHDIGKNNQRWSALYTNLINGEIVTTKGISVGGATISLRQGNIFYVSVEGNNANVGDHPQGPLETIEEAISRCDASTSGPVIIYVFPGVYQESLPLVLPDDVQIVGAEMRNTIIVPDTSSQSEDVFHLNDSSTVANLTIKDFYYDSINDKGYAFRFAPNAVITSRSPYIQNVTVITQGTTTSASDPRGFASGDAGKGALIDGAELDNASIEASMLFHSATFITPGVDGITMTNGVRVEWLNSFTYFANRGLYLKNGITGRTTYDGSTVEYGAELRSIGSASVYGNYGIEADGSDCLAYLIQHNFGYIGSGKFSDNDSSRAVQSQEVVELNSGQVHYVTTDHYGNFRIGDNFLIDFETGDASIDASSISTDGITNLVITDGTNESILTVNKVQTGNVRFTVNNIDTITGALNITPANEINIPNDVNISNNLDIVGDLNFDGSLNLLGNEASDTLTFNVNIDQNLNPNTTESFSLGSSTKEWANIHIDSAQLDDLIFSTNFISTLTSNSDLELRANGTGKILIPSNDVQIDNNLTVSGTTDIQDTTVTGTITHTGNRIQTGNYSVSNLNVSDVLDVSSQAQFEEILFEDNVITTTSSNADLELRASGTGNILLQNDTVIENNLSIENLTTTSTVNLGGQVSVNDFELTSGIEVKQNYITTTQSNADLELRASGTGEILIPNNNLQINNNLTVSTDTDLQSTAITGSLTHTGNRNQTGNYTLSGELTVDNIYVEDNFITTTSGNLTLSTGSFTYYDITITAYDTFGNPIVPYVGLTIVKVNDPNTEHELVKIEQINPPDPRYYRLYLVQTGTNPITLPGQLAFLADGSGDPIYDPGSGVRTFGAIDSTGSSVINTVNVNTNDVGITQDLTVSGATSLQGTSITGTVTQTGDRTQTGNLDIAGEISNGNILFEDNFITTTNNNSDLELRASGTGEILVPTTKVLIQNDLNVNGTTNLQNTTINGALTSSSDIIQTGNYTISGELTVDDVLVEDNFITTVSSDADLELRASGTGEVLIPNNNLHIVNNSNIQGTTSLQGTTITGNLNMTGGLRAQTGDFNLYGELTVDNVYVEDNFITTTNGNLILSADGPPDLIVIDSNDVTIGQGLTINDAVDIDSLAVTGNITQTGNRTQVGNLSIAGELSVDSVYIEDNFVTTSDTNADLELRASGTGEVLIPNNDVTITNNLTVDGDTSLRDTNITGVLTHTGTKNFTGDYSVTNLTITGDLTTGSQAQFEEILFDGNVVSTTTTNANLELRASGTGNVIFNEDLNVNNNLFAASITTGNITIDKDLVLDEIVIPPSIIEIDDNFISTKISNADLDLRANGSGVVYFPSNDIEINNNLTVNSNTDLQSTTITGTVTQTGNRTQTGNFDVAGEISNGNILIEDNFITTTTTNSDLELRASGTGEIVVDSQDTVTINNNLFVGGTMTYQGALTINGNVVLQGNTQDGSLTVTENFEVVGKLDISKQAQFEEILVDDNVITTTTSNTDLELRASGTGEVLIPNNDVQVDNSLSADSLSTSSMNIDDSVSLEILELSTDIQFEDNVITTTNSNSNLELKTQGSSSVYVDGVEITGTTIGTNSPIDSTVTDITFDVGSNLTTISGTGAFKIPVGNNSTRNLISGSIRYNSEENIFEGFGNTVIGLGGVRSADNLTSLTAHPTNNTINIEVAGTNVASVDKDGLNIHGMQVDDILFDGLSVGTNVSNSDLELRTVGTGAILIDNIKLKGNDITQTQIDTKLQIGGTGQQWVIFEGDNAVKFPSGTTLERPANPQIGQTRHNSTLGELETWTGTEWVTSAGKFENVSQNDMEEEAFVQTLIYG